MANSVVGELTAAARACWTANQSADGALGQPTGQVAITSQLTFFELALLNNNIDISIIIKIEYGEVCPIAISANGIQYRMVIGHLWQMGLVVGMVDVAHKVQLMHYDHATRIW